MTWLSLGGIVRGAVSLLYTLNDVVFDMVYEMLDEMHEPVHFIKHFITTPLVPRWCGCDLICSLSVTTFDLFLLVSLCFLNFTASFHVHQFIFFWTSEIWAFFGLSEGLASHSYLRNVFFESGAIHTVVIQGASLAEWPQTAQMAQNSAIYIFRENCIFRPKLTAALE